MLVQERQDDLRVLLTWIRYAAALQPDATRLPAERCQVRQVSCDIDKLRMLRASTPLHLDSREPCIYAEPSVSGCRPGPCCLSADHIQVIAGPAHCRISNRSNALERGYSSAN